MPHAAGTAGSAGTAPLARETADATGKESCRAIRAASGIPIFVVSALNHELEALSMGATAFFSKPVNVGPLLACIDVCTGAADATPRQSPQT